MPGALNDVLAVYLMATKLGVPVCPHAGGVGLCEMVQHLQVGECNTQILYNGVIRVHQGGLNLVDTLIVQILLHNRASISPTLLNIVGTA